MIARSDEDGWGGTLVQSIGWVAIVEKPSLDVWEGERKMPSMRVGRRLECFG